MLSAPLDMRTMLLATTVTLIVCSAAAAWAWTVDRSRHDSSSLWLVAYVLTATGWLLLALRGVVPSLLSIVAANTMIVLGLILVCSGTERYFGIRRSQVANYVVLALLAALMTWFAVLNPDLGARNILSAAATTLVCAQTAWCLLADRKDPRLHSARHRVASVIVWFSVLGVARIVHQVFTVSSGDFLQSGAFEVLVVVLGANIGYVALAFALILLVNEDLVSELRQDVVSRERTEDELRHLSEHDELTGLLNGRAFRAYAEARLAERGSKSAQVVYFDLDVLKRVNDTCGHDAGDNALASFAGVLASSFRDSDVIARIGGDEFVVLALMRAPLDHTDLLARYHERLAAFNSASQLPYALSASYGIADAAPGDRIDLQELVKTADARMYEAKESARICHAAPA